MREMRLYSILDRELIQQTQREVVVLQETRIIPSSDVRCHDVKMSREMGRMRPCYNVGTQRPRR